MAAVDFSGRKGRSSKQKKRSKSSDGRARQKGTGRRRWGSEGGGSSGLQSPISELGEGSQEARGSRRRTRRRKRGTQSLPRNAFRNNDSETERGTKKERKKERKRGQSKRRGRESGSEEREKKVEDEEAERAEEEQEVPAVEERQEGNGGQAEEVEEGVDLDTRESDDDDVFLPVPSPQQKLPRPKQDWEVESKDNWDVTAEYREMRREKEQERSWDDDSDENKETQLKEDQTEDDVERSLPGVAGIEPLSQRKPFSFLTSTLSVGQLGDDESEYGGSQSDASVSAASISGLSLVGGEAGRRRAAVLPGRWLKPSQQRVDAVMQGNEHQGRRTGQEGGGSSVS